MALFLESPHAHAHAPTLPTNGIVGHSTVIFHASKFSSVLTKTGKAYFPSAAVLQTAPRLQMTQVGSSHLIHESIGLYFLPTDAVG